MEIFKYLLRNYTVFYLNNTDIYITLLGLLAKKRTIQIYKIMI